MFLRKLFKIRHSASALLTTPACCHKISTAQRLFHQTGKLDYCSEKNVQHNPDDLSNKFAYTDEEVQNILKNLNSMTSEEMLKFNISKKITSSFFARKEKMGEYNNLVDLLYIDSVGIKQARKLCNVALLDTPEEVQQIKETSTAKLLGLMNKKKLIKPYYDCDTCETVIAITISPNYFAWTEMICPERKIVDIQYHHLSKSLTRIDLSKIHDVILDAVCIIPDADVYIVENTPSHFNINRSAGLTSSRVNYLVNNALIRGIALTLLQSKAGKGFYYLTDSVPVKLFNLKVGYDRQSSVNIVKSILNNTHEISWLPCVYSDDKQYFQMSHPPASDSALLALAFLETIYEQNLKALELLL